MKRAGLETYLQNMPKVELHIHLEGSIPLNAFWELFKKYDHKKEIKSIDELAAKFWYSDFPHFIETWVWKNHFINEYDDFTFIASEVKKDLSAQNIVYCEMFYSPPDFRHKNLEPQKITEAIRKGFDRINEGTEINLVADVVRDFGAGKAMITLNEINEVKHSGVLGIGIGGSEHAFPPELFTDVFEKARSLGFHTSAHAGEAAGVQSIWGAVRSLRAERIGHGTRAFEDPELVKYLADNRIPVEACPISNVKTGVVKNLSDHPVADYYQSGLVVFLNTDDPKMFHNTMVDEYSAFVDDMGFELDDVHMLMYNAISSAWCDERTKNRLRMHLEHYINNNSY